MKNLGQLFMVALKGDKVSVAERLTIREMQPCGFTHFTRNLITMDQIAQLNSDLLQLFEPLTNGQVNKPILAIDQEGGLKERLPKPFTHWPGNRALAAYCQRIGDYEPAKLYYRAIGHEIASVGFNTNFVPVMDVVDSYEDTYIGERAFGTSPQLVADVGCAAIQGTMAAGVVACAKHYPGHGATQVDSHLALPIIPRTRQVMWHHDLIPFRQAIAYNVPLIMTAHIVYTAEDMDPKNPATMSSAIIGGLLRQDLNFQGLIVTDDLNMMAIAKKYDEVDAARQALMAGCDILLYCDGVEKAQRVYEAIKVEVEKTPGSPLAKRVEDSIHRVQTWKNLLLKDAPVPLIEKARKIAGSHSHRELAQLVRSV